MDNVLLPSEIEFYIETMRPKRLDDIGNESWLEWHDRLQKLNQQATVEASAMKDEQVKECLISLDKTNILVHEAILINVWKYKIFPLLLQLDANPDTTFICYSVLFHEAVCASLLELIVYHGDGCESLGDSAADLLDYVYDCVTQLLVLELDKKGVVELVKQKEDLAFMIGVKCLSIVRYLAEHMERISLSVTNRLYTTHDIPILIAQILLQKPWVKSDKIYVNNKWITADSEAVCQAEAQCWLCLRNLLLDKACMSQYEFTDSRKAQLVKLLPLMTPTLLDQMSPLMELNHWLCQMSVSALPPAKHRPILLETVLEIKERIMRQGEKKWKKLARSQVGVIFCTDKQKVFEAAQKLNSAYNTELLEAFETKASGNCTVCGKGAAQRCSKCKNEWYCSRECQVKDWKTHKETCFDVVEANAGAGDSN